MLFIVVFHLKIVFSIVLYSFYVVFPVTIDSTICSCFANFQVNPPFCQFPITVIVNSDFIRFCDYCFGFFIAIIIVLQSPILIFSVMIDYTISSWSDNFQLTVSSCQFTVRAALKCYLGEMRPLCCLDFDWFLNCVKYVCRCFFCTDSFMSVNSSILSLSTTRTQVIMFCYYRFSNLIIWIITCR